MGVRGINDYTAWFASDPDMQGDYSGYDGPCPPWNDEIIHHYHFTVYALKVPSLRLPERFDGHQARAALQPHILAEGAWVGRVRAQPHGSQPVSSLWLPSVARKRALFAPSRRRACGRQILYYISGVGCP